MKRIIPLLPIMLAFCACNKHTSSDSIQETTSCRLLKFVQGIPGEDTTHTLHYGDSGRLNAIVDEDHTDTMTLSYNAQDLLDAVARPGQYPLYSFEYNATGKPVVLLSRFTKTELTYEMDTILKEAKTYAWTGVYWQFAGSFIFTLNEIGDISQIHEYSSGGQKIGERLITYTNIESPFTSLVLINFENTLGLQDVLPLSEFGFMPSKLINSYIMTDNINGVRKYEMTYVQDNQQKLLSSVVTRTGFSPEPGTFTRKYEYECR